MNILFAMLHFEPVVREKEVYITYLNTRYHVLLRQASTQRQRNYLFIHSSKDTALQLLLVQCLINLHYDLMIYCCLKSSAVLLTILTFTFFVFCSDK
jgi:hypothetical protein